jgi:signal transduction histidine kinase
MDNAAPSVEEQLALLREQLAAAQKLSCLGELASTISHEFNNVLTTIINYAQLGLRHQDTPTRDKALSKILSASQRAAKITGSILGMARRRTQGFEPTDLKQVLEDTLLLLEREMNKYRIAVETYYHEAPPALTNPGQIQQVLLNLLINARQAMPHGGRVILKLGVDESGEMVELTVRDTGIGIPAENLPRLFEPFFTTKTPDASGKGGTGLGLAMCREIIEAHHGRIRVESTPGKGTAFTLRLPLARGSRSAAAPSQDCWVAGITPQATSGEPPAAV